MNHRTNLLYTLAALGFSLLWAVQNPAFAADLVVGTPVQTIFTKFGDPALDPATNPDWFSNVPINYDSPDGSDIVYLGTDFSTAQAGLTYRNTLVICDGEVDEMTSASWAQLSNPPGFSGYNLFEIDTTGTLLNTFTTTDANRAGWSNEPVGCAFNPINNHLYVSDDDLMKVFDIAPVLSNGTLQLFTVSNPPATALFDPTTIGNHDPEGLTFVYDPADATNAAKWALYMVSGLASEIYVIPAKTNVLGQFSGWNLTNVTHFDVLSQGVQDPEGIIFDRAQGLYVVGKPQTRMIHIYTNGPLIRTVDISAFNAGAGPRKPAGLALAPASNDPFTNNVYISSRGVDNNSDPNEDDGAVYEVSIPPLAAYPPAVAAGPDLTVYSPDVFQLNGAAANTGAVTWTQLPDPRCTGTVTFANPNAEVTSANFNTGSEGICVLRLSADNDPNVFDNITVQVRHPNAGFSTIYVSPLLSTKVYAHPDTPNDPTNTLLSVANEDIIAFDTVNRTWSMYFKGKMVGLGATGVNVDAFKLMEDGSILLSLDVPATLPISDPSVGTIVDTLIDDSDIVRFIPTALGDNTAGSFEFYFDGSDVGLDTDSEDIDAIGFLPNGNLVISLTGSGSVPGVSTVQDEDLIAFTASGLGVDTSGTWTMHLDGSDVELSDGGNNEDTHGVWIDSNNVANPDSSDIYISTRGAFSVTGAIGDGADIFKCTPASIGTASACSYAFSWDGGGNGIPAGAALDDFDLVPMLSSSGNTPPTTSISSPADGASFAAGTSITFTGTAIDNEDGNLTASLTWISSLDGAIGSGGSFSISTLSPGTHTITALATDSGNFLSDSSISVTVNSPPGNSAPTASISAPADAAAFTAGDPVIFTGTASDTEDGDLTTALTWTSSLDGAIGSGGSFSTSTLSVGTHTITASVTDSGSLTGTASITITVNAVGNAAPTASINAPANGAAFTEGDPVTFTGTATDNEDGNLTASLNWTSSRDGAIGSGGSFSTTTLSPGTHSITASVTDSGGALGSSSITLTVNPLGGGPIPVHQWLFDENTGTTAADTAGTNNANLTNVSWVAGKTGNAAAFNGTNAEGDAGQIDFGTSNFTVAHWVKVTSFNNYAGIFNNRSSASGNIGFHTRTDGTGTLKALIDFGASSRNIAITNAVPGTWYHVAVAVDRAGLMKLYVDGVLADQIDISTFSAISLTQPDNVRLGRDQASNFFNGTIDDLRLYNSALSDAEILALYTGNTPGNSAPTASISTPADAAAFTVGDPVTFTGTASDTEDGDLTASLSWASSLDGPIGSGGGFTTSTLSVGTHTITASATDSGSLTGSTSISVTVNAVGNSTPTASISAPADAAAFTAGDPVTFTGTASDTEDGDLTPALLWTSSLDGPIGSGGGFTTSTLSVGTHTITASATDSGSLTGTASISVTVNAVGNSTPTASISAPADTAAFTAGDPVTFTGTAFDTEDGDLTPALLWTSSLDGPIGSGGGFTTSTLSVGTHTITASATDSGSLTGSTSISVTVNAVGNSTPTANISAPANGAAFTAGDPVTFTGTASDTEDGDLTASLTWTSSLDGPIGSGNSFSISTLSPGTHTITASVTDSGGALGSSAITVTVNPLGGGPIPAHQWQFDENTGTTAVDSAGTNNATLSNTTWVDGKTGTLFDKAASFNGTNASGDAGQIDFGTGNFTVAHWVKVDTFNAYAGIFNNRSSASGNIGFHTRTDGTGTLKALIDFGASSRNIAITNAAPGIWYHVAVTVDRAGLMKLYVDGVLADQVDISTFSAISLTQPDNVRLGRDQASNFFSGTIDDLRLYNSALSEAEILDLYNQ